MLIEKGNFIVKVPVKQKVVPLYKLFCLLCYSFSFDSIRAGPPEQYSDESETK